MASSVFERYESLVKTDEIVEVLTRGGLVIYPTETMYGVGADATNDKAIKKLGEYKQRPAGKPYSIAVANQEMAEEYVELNQTARNLYKNFLPGPMTIVSRGKHKLAPGVESENGTVGVRISSYPLVTEIVTALGKPITATSANASYKKRPYKVSDIWENISDKQKALIDLVIDAGELEHNEPSTVVDTTLDDVVVLRQGGLQILNFKFQILSRGEEDTKNLGKELWQKYEKYAGQRAIIFALEGEMGAGKTVFTKGLAKGMGVEEEIISPTYVMGSEFMIHGLEIKLEHIDAWRMQSPEELEQLGLKGMISDKAVLAIEWADRAAEVIRKYNEEAVIIWVKIGYADKENERRISWGVNK